MAHPKVLVVLVLMILVCVARVIARVRAARHATSEHAYRSWLRGTLRLLRDEEEGYCAVASRHSPAGPRIRVSDTERLWAYRAVDERRLAWTGGRRFVTLHWTLRSRVAENASEPGTGSKARRPTRGADRDGR